MNKKGALFYIIDAFVAASIIAITITMILASDINSPETEIVQERMENYLTYIEKTTIINTPGTIATSIINQELINSPTDSILSAVVQLHAKGNTSLAQEFLEGINEITIASNYGLNLSIIETDGTTTIITTKNANRLNNSKTYLEKKMIYSFILKAEERITNTPITSTGDAACAPDKCIYVIDDTELISEQAHHDVTACSNVEIGLKAECYGYNASTVYIYTVKVSVWV